MLGYVSVTVNAIKEQVCYFLSQVEITQECSMEKVEKAVEIEISKLEETIIQSEHSLERKRKHVALDEMDDLEYEL
jgi:SHS2 domain-containing protein